MAIGERIRFFRKMRGMTQKYLGQLLGFPEKSADVRMAQYESEARIPREDVIGQLAQTLEVSPLALKVPDIDSYLGLIHTLFTLEDLYGLTIASYDGDYCIRLNKKNGKVDPVVFEMLEAWQKQRARVLDGQIFREDYDEWRYHYPAQEQSRLWKPNSDLVDEIAHAAAKGSK